MCCVLSNNEGKRGELGENRARTANIRKKNVGGSDRKMSQESYGWVAGGLLVIILGLLLVYGHYAGAMKTQSLPPKLLGGMELRCGMLYDRGGFPDGARIPLAGVVEGWVGGADLGVLERGIDKPVRYQGLGKTVRCFNALDFLMNNLEHPWTMEELIAVDNDVVKEQFLAFSGVKPCNDNRARIKGWVGGRYYGIEGVPNPYAGTRIQYRPKDARDLIRRCYTRGDGGMEDTRANWPHGTYFSRTQNLMEEAIKLGRKMGLDTIQMTWDPCRDGTYKYRVVLLSEGAKAGGV